MQKRLESLTERSFSGITVLNCSNENVTTKHNWSNISLEFFLELWSDLSEPSLAFGVPFRHYIICFKSYMVMLCPHDPLTRWLFLPNLGILARPVQVSQWCWCHQHIPLSWLNSVRALHWSKIDGSELSCHDKDNKVWVEGKLIQELKIRKIPLEFLQFVGSYESPGGPCKMQIKQILSRWPTDSQS